MNPDVWKEGGGMMKEKTCLNREVFLSIAKASGLDTEDPHMEELYSYIQNLLPGLKRIEKLDLRGIEPFMPTFSSKE